MYQKAAEDASFFFQLFKFDKEMSEQVRSKRCPFCGSKLDSANYHRKPRGTPKNVDPTLFLRHSFSCRREGCRKRTLPPSLRFFGRTVWNSTIFLIAAILQGDCSPSKTEEFIKEMGISRQTLSRWRKWWAGFYFSKQGRIFMTLTPCNLSSDTNPLLRLRKFLEEDFKANAISFVTKALGILKRCHEK